MKLKKDVCLITSVHVSLKTILDKNKGTAMVVIVW